LPVLAVSSLVEPFWVVVEVEGFAGVRDLLEEEVSGP
jgi:hypothetical protein